MRRHSVSATMKVKVLTKESQRRSSTSSFRTYDVSNICRRNDDHGNEKSNANPSSPNTYTQQAHCLTPPPLISPFHSLPNQRQYIRHHRPQTPIVTHNPAQTLPNLPRKKPLHPSCSSLRYQLRVLFIAHPPLQILPTQPFLPHQLSIPQDAIRLDDMSCDIPQHQRRRVAQPAWVALFVHRSVVVCHILPHRFLALGIDFRARDR